MILTLAIVVEFLEYLRYMCVIIHSPWLQYHILQNPLQFSAIECGWVESDPRELNWISTDPYLYVHVHTVNVQIKDLGVTQKGQCQLLKL